jgi:hypothetical protein
MLTILYSFPLSHLYLLACCKVMRADKERLLHGVLLPLHGSAALGEYHGSLCMCIAHYIARDSPVGAATPRLTGAFLTLLLTHD